MAENANACGSSCVACTAPPANATATCINHVCDFTCNTGFFKCGDKCYPGTGENANACGPLCVACPPPPANGAAVCVDGLCKTTCDAGYLACGPTCLPAQRTCTSSRACCAVTAEECVVSGSNSGCFLYYHCMTTATCAGGTCYVENGAFQGYCAAHCVADSDCPPLGNGTPVCFVNPQGGSKICGFRCSASVRCPTGMICSASGYCSR
jgi:hypothetical protein